MKDKLSILLRVGVSFGLLGFLFWLMRDDVKSIGGILSGSDLKYVAGAFLLFVVNTVMLSYRMKLIFRGENLDITLKEASQLTFVGYFFNNFMPTAVGGDIIKAHYASCHNSEKIRSYASVLMDRLIGLYSFLILAAMALLVDKGKFESLAIKPLVFCLVLIGLAGFIIATNKKVAAMMERFFTRIKMFGLGNRLNAVYDIGHDYRNRKDVVVRSFAVSLVAQCVYFLVIYMFFQALNADMGIGNVFLIMPVVTFISMIPSVGGLGVREGAIVAFFTPVVGRETAFAVSLLLLAGLFLISLLGGLVYLWWTFRGMDGKTSKDNV